MRASCLTLALLFTAMGSSPLSAALLASADAQASIPPATYPAVSWQNDAAHEHVGRRVIDAMRAAGLHPVVTCSAGCTVSVPSPEYASALNVANQLVRVEHLDLTVLGALPTS